MLQHDEVWTRGLHLQHAAWIADQDDSSQTPQGQRGAKRGHEVTENEAELDLM